MLIFHFLIVRYNFVSKHLSWLVFLNDEVDNLFPLHSEIYLHKVHRNSYDSWEKYGRKDNNPSAIWLTLFDWMFECIQNTTFYGRCYNK